MKEIRINISINADENPELHGKLLEVPARRRAALLRNMAEFGLWAKSVKVIGVSPSELTSSLQTRKPAIEPYNPIPTPQPQQETVEMQPVGLDISVLNGSDVAILD